MSNPHVKRKKVCVYCGSRKNLTRDHVPPKCLFATPPQNAITVPSCRRCNGNASRDDEYFRLIVANRRDIGDNTEALSVAKKAVKSLQRQEARKFRRSFLSGVDFRYLMNERGVIEPGGSYYADHVRLGRVASRIVKGLFWHKTSECLPSVYEVTSWVDAGLPYIKNRDLQIFALVMMEEPIRIGRNVFKCWHKSVVEDMFTSVWVLQFYENVHIFCMTATPQFKPTDQTRPRSNPAGMG